VKILLLGSGAREHALARALARDPQTTELVVAPGNPGTAAIATNLNIDPCAPEEVVALAAQMEADLVVVGPEGGISPEETAALEAAGAMTVRLGPHVMRTASAGPVALAVLAHASGLWE